MSTHVFTPAAALDLTINHTLVILCLWSASGLVLSTLLFAAFGDEIANALAIAG